MSISAKQVCEVLNAAIEPQRSVTLNLFKAFDIKNHKFGSVQLLCKDDGLLSFNIDIENFQLDKKDSIAIAKHFKLTVDDLK